MQTDSIPDQEPWLDKLDDAACLDHAGLADGLERLKRRPSVALHALAGPVLTELAHAAGSLPFRSARSEAGNPENRVYQEFGYCDSVPPDHPLAHLGRWMEARLRRALALTPEPPVGKGYSINDIVCQRYRPGDLGITPHRDHISYTQLIVLLVLCGRGRYFVCADRRGNGKQEIDSAPGWAILMPGPGFAGGSDRPFHTVGDIDELRYSVGMRHDARKRA